LKIELDVGVVREVQDRRCEPVPLARSVIVEKINARSPCSVGGPCHRKEVPRDAIVGILHRPSIGRKSAGLKALDEEDVNATGRYAHIAIERFVVCSECICQGE